MSMAWPLLYGAACMAWSCLGNASCFAVVNVSGLSFERTLQVTVAQGIANRKFESSVYVMGIPQFPGMAGIEWFPGTGPSFCKECHGVRERWLETITLAHPKRRPTALSADNLIAEVLPYFSGGALYDASAPHSLGPVLTACGVFDLLPAASRSSLPPGLEVRFDGRSRWANATAAAAFVGNQLLPLTNRSTLALQAPTNLPFLADAIVMWRLPMLWMADLCRDPAQNAVLRQVIEGSGHFDAAPIVEYVGWFNNTHLPNVELVCQCTRAKRLVTIASDWSENLSFLSTLGPADGAPMEPLTQPEDAVRVHGGYDERKTYVAVVVSDGDNLAQDYSNLRPMLERRISLRSKVPMSWTVSNRWRDFGKPVIEWFYAEAARSRGYDSFLMGPSGYGYTFPGAMSDESAREVFARRTVDAAHELGMQAYVHWDVDQALDKKSRERTEAAVALYNGSAIRGAFMLGSDPIDDVVGDVMVVNKPALPWGFENASMAAATLNALKRGTITYVYTNMKTDPTLVDEMARQLEPHVVLLGHRELIRVAQMRHGVS
jgi:hypothetical protein